MSQRVMRQIMLGAGFVVAVGSAAAWGDGVIIVHPWVPPGEVRPTPVPQPTPLEVRNHRVETEITDNIAVTKIDQIFYNPNPQQLEGTYIFPFADDVAVQKFSMFMDGKQVNGELLDRDKASKIYQDIVNKKRDPALLEYIGTRMYRARVFPIPPTGEVRVQLEYSQTIEVVGGLATYRYPLNTEKFSSKPLNDVSVRVRIRSQLPMATVFCPSHNASVDLKGKNEATVGYEDKNVKPDKDFIVAWQTSTEEFGLAMLTYREAGEDGYFMARIVPSFAADKQALPKDITFVVDTSGSMAGTKIDQARQALKFCLQNLHAEDRFNIVAFSTEVRPWRDSLVPATEKNVTEAKDYASGLQAAGGTAINDALLSAFGQAPAAGKDKRPYMVVFLTDGLPTIGEQNINAILKNVKKANPGSIRLFVFGVGADVNTKLLDKAAEDNHGARQYVSDKENLELVLSNFYGMIANPVLSELNVTFGSPDAFDVYPRKQADLFKGSELVIFGRYKSQGDQNVVLTGQRGETAVRFTWKREFPERQIGSDYLPRLWANRKIAYLLDEMRMNGENKELKDEVVRLAKRYGILTPYTSFLVVEDSEMRTASAGPAAAPTAVEGVVRSLSPGIAGRRGLGQDGSVSRHSFYDMETGGNAVKTSRALGSLKQEQQADAVERRTMSYAMPGVTTASSKPAGSVQGGMGGYGGGSWSANDAGGGAAAAGEPQPQIKFVGSKTFYRKGEQWVDSAYDERVGKQGAKSAPTIKLRMFSDEYYHLLSERREVGKYFAIGSRVIVMIGNNAYETVE